MIRLLADENFNANIVRGVLRQRSDVDIVTVQAVGLSGADDPTVLEWAAQRDRVLLTHDVSTVPRHAYAPVEAGLAMAGVFAVSPWVPARDVIGDILLLVEASLENEWRGQVRFLPL